MRYVLPACAGVQLTVAVPVSSLRRLRSMPSALPPWTWIGSSLSGSATMRAAPTSRIERRIASIVSPKFSRMPRSSIGQTSGSPAWRSGEAPPPRITPPGRGGPPRAPAAREVRRAAAVAVHAAGRGDRARRPGEVAHLLVEDERARLAAVRVLLDGAVLRVAARVDGRRHDLEPEHPDVAFAQRVDDLVARRLVVGMVLLVGVVGDQRDEADDALAEVRLLTGRDGDGDRAHVGRVLGVERLARVQA